jgi:hypothetical protein
VIELLGVHRLDEAQLVGNRRDVLERPGNPRARAAMLAEALRRAEQFRHAGGERETPAAQERFGAVLARMAHQLRLKIEQIEVRRRPGQVQVDDVLRLAREVPGARPQRVGLLRRGAVVQQRPKRDAPQADLAIAQEVPARDVEFVLCRRIHRFRLPV